MYKGQNGRMTGVFEIETQYKEKAAAEAIPTARHCEPRCVASGSGRYTAGRMETGEAQNSGWTQAEVREELKVVIKEP